MKKLKVMTVVGTRPEIIRLACVLQKLDDSDAIDHVLVHTGQNYDYELNEVFFEDMGLRRPTYLLHAAGASAIETIGQLLIGIDPVLNKEKPDALLILGDTNSCLCALEAKKRHIPVFHMEAGNRCFDQRVPEEINRKIVDHISDINMPYSDIARGYLLSENIPPDRIIKTGSPLYEVIHCHLSKVQRSGVLETLGLPTGSYFVISSHREETIDNAVCFGKLVDIINLIAEKFGYPVIVSCHPRTRKMVEKVQVRFHEMVKLIKPLGFTDYLALQLHAKAVLSDSGTISEESAILNFRALNLREAHERPEAMEEGAVMMVGLNSQRVMQGLVQLLHQKIGAERNFRIPSDYQVPNVSDKVLRIILSYTDYIQRVVWKKNEF